MSVLTVGSQEWLEWGRGDTCCFLCGIALLNGEEIILWSGCASPEKIVLPFIPENPKELLLVDALGKQSGGFQPALDIYFHIDCVPSFCRRILQDWERIRENKT